MIFLYIIGIIFIIKIGHYIWSIRLTDSLYEPYENIMRNNAEKKKKSKPKKEKDEDLLDMYRV